MMKETTKRLAHLFQLDVDAVEAYEQAIKQISHPHIRENIVGFQNDHRRHMEDLRRALINLGEEPPQSTPDFQGFFIETFTALRSITGTEGALKAMRMNEKKTNKEYDRSLDLNLADDVRNIVLKNAADEQRHLAYIERALQEKLWELEEDEATRTSA